MILLEGKKIAQGILAELVKEVTAMTRKVRLAVVVVGDDPVVRDFIALKKKAAESIGIEVRVYPFPADITTNALRKRIAEIVHEERTTGLIVQLPLPRHISQQYILNAVVPKKDVDVLSSRVVGDFVVGKSELLPPVVGAIKALLEHYAIPYREKHIALLGAGALVGRPVALWLLRERATFSVLRRTTKNPEIILQQADIVISGIGSPGFVTGDMIKPGAVLIDAGTSESGGRVVGDVALDSVAAKASSVAPVPGGVGPLTVAMLLQNLVLLARAKNRVKD